MNDLLAGFNPMEVQPASGGGGSLPVSDANGHQVIIESAEWKPFADASAGQRLVFSLKITEGALAGTTGFYSLNLGHLRSAEAVNIARADLSAICHCCGWLQPLQQPLCGDLYNRPFRVVVGLQKGEEAAAKGYTEVKKILDPHGNRAGQQKANPEAIAPAVNAAPAPAPVASAPAPSTLAGIQSSIESNGGGDVNAGGAKPGWARPPQ